jgi:hypothetical protein
LFPAFFTKNGTGAILFADFEPFTWISLNPSPGFAQLPAIKHLVRSCFPENGRPAYHPADTYTFDFHHHNLFKTKNKQVRSSCFSEGNLLLANTTIA